MAQNSRAVNSKVLVISKTSTWEQLNRKGRLDVAQLHPNHRARLRQAHDEHYRTIARLEESLGKHQLEWELGERDEVEPPEGYSIIITVGGDGTLLATSRLIQDPTITVIGLRSSLLSVGYLCAFSYENLDLIAEQLQSGTLRTYQAERLGARITRAVDNTTMMTYPALNEFLFANTNPAAMTRYKVRIGEQEEEHKSSGLWISTATGSSAAILAAGGQQVARDRKDFQFVVREPYQKASRTNIREGFFSPDDTPFIIENWSQSAMLAGDGPHSAVSMTFGDVATMVRATPIRLAWN